MLCDTFASRLAILLGHDMASGAWPRRRPLGSRKDRHENIGRGMIGIECFKHLMNDSRLDGIPLIVEARPLQQQFRCRK